MEIYVQLILWWKYYFGISFIFFIHYQEHRWRVLIEERNTRQFEKFII